MNDFFSGGGGIPQREGAILFEGGSDSAVSHIGRMWYCGMDVAYPPLSD